MRIQWADQSKAELLRSEQAADCKINCLVFSNSPDELWIGIADKPLLICGLPTKVSIIANLPFLAISHFFFSDQKKRKSEKAERTRFTDTFDRTNLGILYNKWLRRQNYLFMERAKGTLHGISTFSKYLSLFRKRCWSAYLLGHQCCVWLYYILKYGQELTLGPSSPMIIK